MVRLEDLLTGIAAYNPKADLEVIRKAYTFSAKKHAEQVRKSGEPYLTHPLEVAMILLQLKMDLPTIAVGLLHDTVEDTDISVVDIEKEFGQEIAKLVDGVTKLGKISFRTSQEKQAANFRKMIVAMSEDIRVILVKLADRLHNMRTLGALPEEKQHRISKETLEIYAPIANRLGISWIKAELEDLSFKYLKQEAYYNLVEQMAKKKKEREKYVSLVRNLIREKLLQYNIDAKVEGRSKHLYSIYKKMTENNVQFDQVYDLIAFRIIVASLSRCYESLGVIHSVWTPVPGRFKDYIAMPKANRYQSLHTTVIGPFGERIEIQIRTEEMHKIAEEGIAVHWKYKEGGAVDKQEEESFKWLRSLFEWQKEVKDSAEFLDTMRIDLFDEEVYAFTPKGDIRQLPKGATPIDFAYAIHTNIGDHCTGAKVNGRLVPLKYKLKSGDTIEILTSPTQRPSNDWLDIAKTSRAKAKIRHYLKLEERREGIEIGRKMLAKELRKLAPGKHLTDEGLKLAAEKMNIKDAEELYVKVGYGVLTPSQVLKTLIPEMEEVPPKEEGVITKIVKKAKEHLPPKKDAIQVKGVGQVLVRIAKCCSPLPGDPVTGFITRGRGVTVHKADCAYLMSHDPDRKTEVEWQAAPELRRNVRIRVVCSDRPGLLAEMSQVFSKNNINIANARASTTADKKAINTFEITVSSVSQVTKVIRELEQIPGVISTKRL